MKVALTASVGERDQEDEEESGFIDVRFMLLKGTYEDAFFTP